LRHSELDALLLAMQKVEGSSPFSRLKLLLIPHFILVWTTEQDADDQEFRGTGDHLHRAGIAAVSGGLIEMDTAMLDISDLGGASFRFRSGNKDRSAGRFHAMGALSVQPKSALDKPLLPVCVHGDD
jgi:hypothetical protein